jgi:hypothetical protein
MFNAHGSDGLSNPSGLVGIVFVGPAGGNSAKRTATGTHISKDHERGGAFSPALAHIGAISALTDGVQLLLVHNFPNLRILWPCWKFYTQPVGFANFFCRVCLDGGEFDHSILLNLNTKKRLFLPFCFAKFLWFLGEGISLNLLKS